MTRPKIVGYIVHSQYGEWCKPCNVAYKEARQENGYDES